jgi:hypothetical protein
MSRPVRVEVTPKKVAELPNGELIPAGPVLQSMHAVELIDAEAARHPGAPLEVLIHWNRMPDSVLHLPPNSDLGQANVQAVPLRAPTGGRHTAADGGPLDAWSCAQKKSEHPGQPGIRRSCARGPPRHQDAGDDGIIRIVCRPAEGLSSARFAQIRWSTGG